MNQPNLTAKRLIWSWSSPLSALAIGLVVAAAAGVIGGLAVRWLPGMAGVPIFEVADFMKTRGGFARVMLSFGLVGGLSGFIVRTMLVARSAAATSTPRAGYSWLGTGFALLVGGLVGLSAGFSLFRWLPALESQLRFAGGWETAFALATAIAAGSVGGTAAGVAALGGPEASPVQARHGR